MIQMNLSTKQKQAHIEDRLVVPKAGGGLDYEFGISRCQLLCIEWISKFQQYGIVNCI